MDQYESSLARICLELSGISVFYEDNVPEDFAIPSLYFPPAEQASSGSALNSYQLKYTIYAKVFALTRREAGELAGKIVKGIMERQCRLPVFHENGTDSQMILKLDPPTSWIVDEGMAQVTLTYRLVRAVTPVKPPAASSVGINKYFD